jgi:hypothetical protein
MPSIVEIIATAEIGYMLLRDRRLEIVSTRTRVTYRRDNLAMTGAVSIATGRSLDCLACIAPQFSFVSSLTSMLQDCYFTAMTTPPTHRAIVIYPEATSPIHCQPCLPDSTMVARLGMQTGKLLPPHLSPGNALRYLRHNTKLLEIGTLPAQGGLNVSMTSGQDGRDLQACRFSPQAISLLWPPQASAGPANCGRLARYECTLQHEFALPCPTYLITYVGGLRHPRKTSPWHSAGLDSHEERQTNHASWTGQKGQYASSDRSDPHAQCNP